VLGYGTSGTGLYTDPANDSLGFLRNTLAFGPVLLLGQWLLPSLDPLMFLPSDLDYVPLVLGVGCVATIGLLFAPIVRQDRVAAFWAGGMVLSTVPSCTTAPSDRVLWFVGLGAFGLIGRGFGTWYAHAQARSPRGLGKLRRRAVVAAVIAVHGVAAVIALPFRACRLFPSFIEARLTPPLGADREIEQQTLVILNAPSVFQVAHVPIVQRSLGLPAPRQVRLLGPSLSAVRIRRVSEQGLLLSARRGYLAVPLDALYRRPQDRLEVGDTVALSGMTAEIVSLTRDGRPREVLFRFDRDLDHRGFRWMAWKEGAYQVISPPQVGEMLLLPRPELSDFTTRGAS
jgi:hypothetical protein